jgi:hypothetical protein
MDWWEIALSAALGIALAAATGFRVFVPLLVTSVAAKLGYVGVGENFAWLATTPAVTMLAVAAVAELLAYSIPVVDNALDAVAAPVALVAGTLLAAAVMTDLPPAMKWTLAVVAGGGAATMSQGLTTLLRAKSTLFTGGLGNPLVAAGEFAGALGLSLLALLAPVLALLFVLVALALAVKWLTRRAARRRSTAQPPP